MKKKIGYWLYAVFFHLFRLFPVKKKKVFCIMTHDGSKGSSVGVVVEALKKQDDFYDFYYMKKKDRENALKAFVSFFLIKPYHMATSAYILMDNAFLPMAYLHFSKEAKVVQLWHGTGTIKKFGQDVNQGELKKLEYKANQRITHLIVNSEYTKRQFAKAFGVKEEKVFVFGLPRTDELFSEQTKQRKQAQFYQQYPKLKGKRLVLYAPTFRDTEVRHPKMELDIAYLERHTEEDTVYLIKLHPFVAANYKWEDSLRCINVSAYQDINTLLFVSDVLITDYSSIIFEYCVLEKPMIFFAYDLETFSQQGRGFYEPYENYVPGPVVKDTKEVARLLSHEHLSIQQVKAFKEKSFSYLDGCSMKRFQENVFQETLS